MTLYGRNLVEKFNCSDVNNKSIRDLYEPRSIQDGEIQVPFCGNLDKVQHTMAYVFVIRNCDMFTQNTSLCHIFSFQSI